jgi:type IV secretion system protein VirB4
VVGSIPGNGWDNIRKPMINAGNFAEMVMPVEHWQGTEHIDSRFFPKGTPVPFLSVGTSRSPFYLPSHIRGVAHQLVIGPTTGGKSTLLGALVAATTGIPDVRIVWLDRDYSSFVLAHALGADYRELAADGSSPICPLEYLDHENGVARLFDWFVRLFARWDIQLDEVQVADLTEALETAKSERLRTMTLLMHLVQDQRMRGVLVNYVTGGKWGHIFDGTPVEHAEPARLTVIEMRQLDELGPRAAAPATELIVHGVEVGLGKSPTFVFADEAWKLLADPVSKEWLYTGLRTFRKYNAGFIFATQSLTEVANSDYRDLLLESCYGKIFLPNSEVQGAYVREAYLKLGLTEREIEIIGSAIPQREYYFHSSLGKRKFTLDLGPIALGLCGATGIPDVALAREILAEYGPEKFLEAWLHARGLGPAPTLSIPTQELIVSQSNYANGKVAHQ